MRATASRARVLASALLLVASCPAAFGATHIEHWQTARGTRVYFVRAPELPMVQARLVLDAGSARDPSDLPGLASLTAGMLLAGTGTHDEEELAREFERLGAELSASAGTDQASVELRSLTDPELLDPAIALAAAVVGQPSFDARILERERARLLVALAQEQQSPSSIARRTFYHALYGDHPYGHPGSGTPESVRAVRRADLVSFHARFYSARNAIVVLVGDVSTAHAHEIARRLTANLGAAPAPPPLPDAPPLGGASRKTIAFPSEQAHILIGQPALKRTDPDYLALYVANQILGGGSVSRLVDAVRERAGLAYSVYSYLQPFRARGPWLIGLQTRASETARALSITMDTLRKFHEDGPTEEELVAAKRYLTGSFPLRIDSNREMAEFLAGMAFYGLPLDYLDTYVERINALTREQVHAAFRRHVRPGQLLTVVVGNGRDG